MAPSRVPKDERQSIIEFAHREELDVLQKALAIVCQCKIYRHHGDNVRLATVHVLNQLKANLTEVSELITNGEVSLTDKHCAMTPEQREAAAAERKRIFFES